MLVNAFHGVDTNLCNPSLFPLHELLSVGLDLWGDAMSLIATKGYHKLSLRIVSIRLAHILFFQASFQMSHSNFKNYRPESLGRVDFLEQDLQGFTWPETPRASPSPRLWAENPYVTPPATIGNIWSSTPSQAPKSTDTSNKENQDPQGPSTRADHTARNRKFGDNLKTSRVLQELDINHLPLPSKASRFSNSGL